MTHVRHLTTALALVCAITATASAEPERGQTTDGRGAELDALRGRAELHEQHIRDHRERILGSLGRGHFVEAGGELGLVLAGEVSLGLGVVTEGGRAQLRANLTGAIKTGLGVALKLGGTRFVQGSSAEPTVPGGDARASSGFALGLGGEVARTTDKTRRGASTSESGYALAGLGLFADEQRGTVLSVPLSPKWDGGALRQSEHGLRVARDAQRELRGAAQYLGRTEAETAAARERHLAKARRLVDQLERIDLQLKRVGEP